MDWIEIIATVIAAAVGGGGISWFLLRSERRKREAEASLSEAGAAEKVANTAMQLVEQYRKEQNLFLQRFKVQEERINELEDGNAKLGDSLTLALKRIEDLEAELKARVAELKAEIEKWKKRYYELCAWVRKQGLHPPSEE